MNVLERSLTTTEVSEIRSMLEKLFLLQDRSPVREKINIILNEVLNTGFPYPAIIAGLQDMMAKDYKFLKLYDILENIKEKIVSPETKATCELCGNTGHITMLDEKKYHFALGCRCEKGNKAVGLQRWDGNIFQYIRGKKYELHDTIKYFLVGSI